MKKKNFIESIFDAYCTMCKGVKDGKKLFNLNRFFSTGSVFRFLKAVTSSFNEREHGFFLQKIFQKNEDGSYTRLDTPNNPQDVIELCERIHMAMNFIAREKAKNQSVKKARKEVLAPVNPAELKVKTHANKELPYIGEGELPKYDEKTADVKEPVKADFKSFVNFLRENGVKEFSIKF